MADSTTNVTLLRKCGIPEWILVDEDWKEFINFVKESISETNILTDEEMIELALLERNKEGNTISLAERMNKVSEQYDGIWTVSESKIADLEKQIEIDSLKEEMFEDLVIKTRMSNLDAIEILTVLKGQNSKLLSEERIVTDEAIIQMDELQEVKLSNERKIGELSQLYLKSAQNPLFMHQMPLNEYFRQLEQFNDGAKHFIQKNFKIQDPEDCKQGDKAQVLNDLSIVADRLLNAYNKLYLAEMNYNAKTALTNQFRMKNWSPSTLIGMRRDLNQMEHDNELNEGQKQHLLHKLQEQVIELSQLDVEALIYESNQKRMKRAKQRMQYLTEYSNLVSEVMTISEMFWVLMQLDMERMKNRNNFDSKLDAYRMESLGCNRRIEILNVIRKLNNETMILSYCNQLKEHLQVSYVNSKEFDIEEIVKSILSVDQFRSILWKLIQTTGQNSFLTHNSVEFFNRVSFIENLIRKFLFDGTVAKPQQHNECHRKKRMDLERELMKICAQNELKKEECSHYIKKWSDDKYWRHKQILWVWFITEPKKVLKSLKSISIEAQQHSKHATIAPRHIVGIVRKK